MDKQIEALREMAIELVKQTADTGLLDLICRLLVKSEKEA